MALSKKLIIIPSLTLSSNWKKKRLAVRAGQCLPIPNPGFNKPLGYSLKFCHLVIHTYNFHQKRITFQRKFSVLTGLAGEGNKPTPGQIELRLIQSLDDIRNPKISFKAHLVTNWFVSKWEEIISLLLFLRTSALGIIRMQETVWSVDCSWTKNDLILSLLRV